MAVKTASASGGDKGGLSAAGWGRRRNAKELGCLPDTNSKYLRPGGWQAYWKSSWTSVARCQLHWRFVTITLAGEARVIGASGSLVG